MIDLTSCAISWRHIFHEKKKTYNLGHAVSLNIKHLNRLYQRRLIVSWLFLYVRRGNWCRNALLTGQNKVERAIESRAIYLSQITARFDTFVADRCIMNIPSLTISIKYMPLVVKYIRERSCVFRLIAHNFSD